MECTFEGCTNKALARSLCTGHYKQARRGLELRPLRPRKLYAAPGPGLKICTACDRVLELDEFYDRSDGKGKRPNCKECSIAQVKAWQAAHKAEDE